MPLDLASRIPYVFNERERCACVGVLRGMYGVVHDV